MQKYRIFGQLSKFEFYLLEESSIALGGWLHFTKYQHEKGDQHIIISLFWGIFPYLFVFAVLVTIFSIADPCFEDLKTVCKGYKA